MQGVSFRKDIMETGQPGNPATAQLVQTTSQELRTAVLPLEPQVSTTSASAVSGTTSVATVGSKQSASIGTVNSVEVEFRFILP